MVGVTWRSVSLSGLALATGLLATPRVSAYGGYPWLSFSGGGLVGYSETWKDPLDTDEEYCEYVDRDHLDRAHE